MIILSVIVSVFGFGHVQAAQKIIPKIVVGANLAEYKKPIKRQCNINVPAQYSTIQAAVDAAITGNTICVEAGVYNEDVWIKKSIKLSGTSNIGGSIINGQSPLLATVIINADNVTLEGFTINGVAPDNTPGVRDVPALLIWEAHSNNIVQYNKIKSGNGGIVIRADAKQNNHLIKNNILESNNSPLAVKVSGAPLDPSKPSNKVDFISNTFVGTVNQTDVADTGIVLTEHATNSLIERNLFDTTGSSTKLLVYAYGSGTAGVHYNNFSSATVIKVYVSVGTLNAENNWWGDLDPSDNIVHDVDFTPFATSPFQQKSCPLIRKFGLFHQPICFNQLRF